MVISAGSFSELERVEVGLVDDLIKLLESGNETENDLEKLQIKLNMVHETQVQAAHLTFEDLKQLKIVTAQEVLKEKDTRKPRKMRISFEEMPVVWPIGVKERFIRKMIEYDHTTGDYILNFFGKGVVEATGVRLTFSAEDAKKVCYTYLEHANKLAEKLDLTVVQ